jgi:hypothetical protein
MTDLLHAPDIELAPAHAPGNHPPDGGEPQGARDSDQPPMLGKKFRMTVVMGSCAGLLLALAAHYLITQTVEDSTKFNSWSWGFAAIGGLTVGAACSLFIYGAATDRSDTDEAAPRGRADVSERGEWRRTLDRRRLRQRGTAERDKNRKSRSQANRAGEAPPRI